MKEKVVSKKMKVFSINGYFLLPDKFDGTLGDALELLSTYYKNKEKNKTTYIGKRVPLKEIKAIEYQDKIWDGFAKALNKNRKFHALCDIFEWNEKQKKWKSVFKKETK